MAGGGARRRVAAARGVARRVARASSHSREGRPSLVEREGYKLGQYLTAPGDNPV